MSASIQPVLILGGGINGCAIARELLLNDVPVCLVDTGDIASGTTAYSSRLIHGGLRYLEYGEFDLVRESLAERSRLLQLAPQFVRPLRLFIPVKNRFGGLLTSARRFLRMERKKQPRAFDLSDENPPSRGVWLARMGLWMYDAYSRTPNWPRHRVHRAGDANTPPVDPARYRWLCSYSDSQIAFPERFVVAMVEDARRIAKERQVSFQLLTYHRAALHGKVITIQSCGSSSDSLDAAKSRPHFEPSAIINATGSWVDRTLHQLHVASRRLMGGTKGSHFFTTHAGLRSQLNGQAIYGEADDGRPVFILPLAGGTLVGTTDIPFEGNPADAVATQDELNYLLGVVNEVLPQVRLTHADIDWHYCGVRPLPYTGADTPASITRRHWLEENKDSPVPLYSVIGGKLTTCRSLAESAAKTILARLELPVRIDSGERVFPGGENYPQDDAALAQRWQELSETFALCLDQVQIIWSLLGTRTAEILRELSPFSTDNLTGTKLLRAIVRWVIEHEWVQTLADLVERRLMLLYQSTVTPATLHELAEMLVEAGILAQSEVNTEVQRVTKRLHSHFGKQLKLASERQFH